MFFSSFFFVYSFYSDLFLFFLSAEIYGILVKEYEL